MILICNVFTEKMFLANFKTLFQKLRSGHSIRNSLPPDSEQWIRIHSHRFELLVLEAGLFSLSQVSSLSSSSSLEGPS